jgi:hypothetical protein
MTSKLVYCRLVQENTIPWCNGQARIISKKEEIFSNPYQGVCLRAFITDIITLNDSNIK